MRFTPSALGCSPSAWFSAGTSATPARKNGSYSTPGRWPSRSNTRAESRCVVRPEIGQRVHAGQQHRDVPRRQPVEDCRQVASRYPVGIDAAQPVIGPKLDDRGIRAVAQRPVEPRQAAGRVSPDTAPSMIGTSRPCASQRRAELRLEAVGVRQAVAGGRANRPAPAAAPARRVRWHDASSSQGQHAIDGFPPPGCGRHMLPPWMPLRRLRFRQPQSVQVRNLRLTVPSAAGPVNILRGIDLDIAPGRPSASSVPPAPARPAC